MKNVKNISIAVGWVSALVLSYFAIDLLTSLGDWGRQWAADPKILIAAMIIALPPASAVYLGIILVEQAKKTSDVMWSLLSTHIPAWIWLYVGSLILAIARFQ